MKTNAIFAAEKHYVILIGCILLFSSCQVYKPMITARDTSKADLMNSFKPGEHYSILVEGGNKVYIKVDSVMSDQVRGNARIVGAHSSTRHEDYIVYYHNVVSVSERKFSLPVTLWAIGGAAAAFVLLAPEILQLPGFRL